MTPKHEISPLDKDALLLLPGLRYARSLIDVAMHVCRNSALRPAGQQPASPLPEKSN